MIKSFFIPLLILYLAASCKKEDGKSYIAPNPPNPPVMTPTPSVPADTSISVSYLALGDSYTIGQSVAVNDRFPNQAAALLLADSIKVTSPEIIAQTGWTTGDLIGRINSNGPLKSSYDIVSLLIGVNNQYRHLPQTQYSDEFTLLLNKAIAYAGNIKKRVFVLSIPDYSVTPFASGSDRLLISSQVDSFNVINQQLTIAAGCNYLNITTSTRQALNDPSLVASDGLHPSGKEYRKWAGLLSPLIKASLR